MTVCGIDTADVYGSSQYLRNQKTGSPDRGACSYVQLCGCRKDINNEMKTSREKACLRGPCLCIGIFFPGALSFVRFILCSVGIDQCRIDRNVAGAGIAYHILEIQLDGGDL